MKSGKESCACSICGDTRDTRLHYGVISCIGCKAFFRRAVNGEKAYRCIRKGNCLVDRRRKNSCRACRFQKCIDKGMRPLEVVENRKRDRVELPSTDPLSTPQSLSAATFSPQGGGEATEEVKGSMELLDRLVVVDEYVEGLYDPHFEHVTEETMHDVSALYGKDISLEMALSRPELICPRTKLSYACDRLATVHDFKFTWFRFFAVMVDWAKGIPTFVRLSVADQAALIRQNFSTCGWVHYAPYVGAEKGYPFGNGSYLPRAPAEISRFCAEHLGSIMTDLSAWIPVAEKCRREFLVPMRELQVDRREFCAIKALLLFQPSSDMSEEGSEICTRMQERLVDALHDSMAMRFPNLSSRARARRLSRILLLLNVVSAVWHFECDFHVMMSIFDVDLQGIPMELLSQRSRPLHRPSVPSSNP